MKETINIIKLILINIVFGDGEDKFQLIKDIINYESGLYEGVK